MITIGKYNTLTIDRHMSVGLYLTDGEGEDVLLPNKYIPDNFSIGDTIEVFVYLDSEERKVATTLEPKIKLHEFGFLRVSAVTEVGAFMGWGLEKELLVPFKEQRQKMQPDRWYIVYLDLDEKTNRLFASNKLEKYLDNESIDLKPGDKVELMVMQQSDLGYSVIVNHKHKGLVYENEVFKDINIGETMPGYVKTIRTDNKLDISLQPPGYENTIDANVETVIRVLARNGGEVSVSDKSTPETIYDTFGMSKKAFKKAIGKLLKEQKISLGEDGIALI
ncbi:MAG: S1 RNA-binding domain-containing protein [Bacteroidota bacterium]